MKIAQVRKIIEQSGATLTYSRVYGAYFATLDGVSSGFYTKAELESMRPATITAVIVAPLCPVDVKESSEAGGDVQAVATYKTGHVYSDGKAQQAVGYSINGEFVMSLPARLNGGRIPDLWECVDILDGVSVRESDGFAYAGRELGKLARSVVLDTVAALPGALWGAALTVTGDGTARGASYVMWCGRRTHTLAVIATTPQRLMAHWAGFVDNCRIEQAASVAEVLERAPVDCLPAMPRRVDLSKPAMPDHVASVLALPQEPAASVLERVAAELRARRLATVPAVHEEQPGNPCDGCNACLPAGESGTCAACAPVLLNHYLCPMCDHEWSDTWSCAVDDDCPECGARAITPYDSEEVDA